MLENMDLERAMEFLLNQQAQLSTSVQQLQISVQGLSDGFGELRENQIQMQRQQLFWQDAFGKALLGLTENLDTLEQKAQGLAEKMDRADARMELLDTSLRTFIDATNARFTSVEGDVDHLKRPN